MIFLRIDNTIQRILTETAMLGGVAIVTDFTCLTAEALGVEETLETLASARVTAIGHVRVNVTVTHAPLARTAGYQWVTVVIVSTLIATITW